MSSTVAGDAVLQVGDLAAALRSAVGEDAVSTDEVDLAEVAHDRSHHTWSLPAAVVRCGSTEMVAKAVRVCATFKVAVIPRGAGTGLEGGANGRANAVVLDMRPMKRILAVHAQDFDAVVEAGVMKSELNLRLAEHGMFFPAGPGVDASFGGMISTGASGTNAVRYGTMSENVMALTVVLADGTVITTGSRTRKSSAGYDLTHLFIGAEGTLGIVTEATVRTRGIPPYSAVMICEFPRVENATAAVYQALKRELPLSRIELLDQTTMAAINSYTKANFQERPTVIFEIQGERAALQEAVTAVTSIAQAAGAISVQASEEPAEIDRIWNARHAALPASAALVEGSVTWSTDVCVPISRLAECIAETQEDIERYGLLAPIVGHVGDGNFHLAFVLVPGDSESYSAAHVVNERLITRALSMGGTSTGEHGIGRGKREALAVEHRDSLAAMKAVKRALDPHNLMNPGTVLAQDDPS